MRFKDRAALVTGAASGIGKATALAFGAEGAQVALVDVNEEGARQVAARIEDAGGRAIVHRADLSKAPEAREAVREAHRRLGRLDVLANVAAIYPAARVLDVTEEAWDAIQSTDLKGPFFTCQEALRIMIPQGSGAIVNVASGAAFMAARGMVCYSAAKGGMVAMSRVMALECARKGVRINVVAPGYTLTDNPLSRLTREQIEAAAEGLVPGRWMTPEEVAEAILFLASDAASGINGAIIHINGGSYMPSG